MKNTVPLLLVIVLAATSCTFEVKKIRYLGDIDRGKVLIVGKVIYNPPLNRDSQDISTTTPEDWYRYKTRFVMGPKLHTIDGPLGPPALLAMGGAIETAQGETLYAQKDPVPTYMIGGIFYKRVYLQWGGRVTSEVFDCVLIPASFLLDIRPEDKDQAIYIGTIIYTRDNFWNITNISIVDDYIKEMPEFRIRFPDLKLRKALIRQPDVGVVPKIGEAY
jgi:hypothetical protein